MNPVPADKGGTGDGAVPQQPSSTAKGGPAAKPSLRQRRPSRPDLAPDAPSDGENGAGRYASNAEKGGTDDGAAPQQPSLTAKAGSQQRWPSGPGLAPDAPSNGEDGASWQVCFGYTCRAATPVQPRVRDQVVGPLWHTWKWRGPLAWWHKPATGAAAEPTAEPGPTAKLELTAQQQAATEPRPPAQPQVAPPKPKPAAKKTRLLSQSLLYVQQQAAQPVPRPAACTAAGRPASTKASCTTAGRPASAKARYAAAGRPASAKLEACCAAEGGPADAGAICTATAAEAA